jgi:hypothetical protein
MLIIKLQQRAITCLNSGIPASNEVSFKLLKLINRIITWKAVTEGIAEIAERNRDAERAELVENFDQVSEGAAQPPK